MYKHHSSLCKLRSTPLYSWLYVRNSLRLCCEPLEDLPYGSHLEAKKWKLKYCSNKVRLNFSSIGLLYGRAQDMFSNPESFSVAASLALQCRTAFVLVLWFSLFCSALRFQHYSYLYNVFRELKVFSIHYPILNTL